MKEQANIYIGTSGWSYPKGEGTWNGYFYPSGKIVELEYFSQYFNTVEINSSFYRPPNPGYVYNWVKRVPNGFLFAMKLWQKFTHPRMYRDATGEEAVISRADVDTFRSSLEPLAKAGKLGALLAQVWALVFPQLFSDPIGLRAIGWIIPGLLANNLERQKVIPTLASLVTVAVATYFIVRILAWLGL